MPCRLGWESASVPVPLEFVHLNALIAMKSLLLTAVLAAVVAYSGSFLTVWTLPHQKDPYTINDMKPAMRKIFQFTEDLRSARSESARKNNSLFPKDDRFLRENRRR